MKRVTAAPGHQPARTRTTHSPDICASVRLAITSLHNHDLFELKPVTRALRNVHANLGSSALFCLQAKSQSETERQTDQHLAPHMALYKFD